MAVPDYFGRNAVAAAQAISGFDEERLGAALVNVCVGITIGRDAHRTEGRALTDLLVRLLARLYPSIVIRSEGGRRAADVARELALRINPRVELTGMPTVEIVVGSSRLRPWAPQRIFVGSAAWTAAISTSRAQPCGDSAWPFGAGVAACLAAANLFRHVFLPDPQFDADAAFSILEPGELDHVAKARGSLGDLVLAGAGAIGQAASWAFARVPLDGEIAIVDHERVDLGNLQRYVLAERQDDGASKPALATRHFVGPLTASAHDTDIATFLEFRGHRIERLLLALDSAGDRRACQASLPKWIANAWTQPGDLGVSTHDFMDGACVCCLYLPERALTNEDAIIAEAFGVPARLMQVRILLHRNEGAPRDLLEAIAEAREVPLDRLLPFEGRPLRALYTEGFCGGAVLPLERMSTPRQEVHVPLAHQSALAGVLLAAASVRQALGGRSASTITQLDVLKPLPTFPTRLAAKDPRGLCICQDRDYREAYAKKFARPVRNVQRRVPGTQAGASARARRRARAGRSTE